MEDILNSSGKHEFLSNRKIISTHFPIVDMSCRTVTGVIIVSVIHVCWAQVVSPTLWIPFDSVDEVDSGGSTGEWSVSGGELTLEYEGGLVPMVNITADSATSVYPSDLGLPGSRTLAFKFRTGESTSGLGLSVQAQTILVRASYPFLTHLTD